MNQILSTGQNEKKPTDIRKIIIFFAISILIFGAVILGQGAYATFKNYSAKVQEEASVPKIQVSKDDKILKVNINHDKIIDKMLYHWNEEQDTIIDGKNRISFEEQIKIPTGTNTLHIKVTDSNGKEAYFVESYTIEDELNIELSIIGNKIKIKAQDPEGMSYLTYKWNNDEEIRKDVDTENATVIELEEEIPVGLNTLIINAVNVNNIVKTKEQDIKGVKKPKVSAIRDGDYIDIIVEDEEGIKTIEHSVNDEEAKTIDGNGLKTLEYKQPIVEGDNYVTIKVKSVSGASLEFKGVCYNQ